MSFTAAVEAAYRDKLTAPGVPPLTRLHVHIAYILANWRSPCPKHRHIAKRAGCSTRTVRRALARLHAFGLLSWTRRVVALVGARVQTSNAYALGSKALLSYQCLNSSAKLSYPAGRGARPMPGDELLRARPERMARLIEAGDLPQPVAPAARQAAFSFRDGRGQLLVDREWEILRRLAEETERRRRGSDSSV